ncbi:hypothetical protein [Methylomonas methanica]|uniref:hypothetical protein n=1 Tax=Methylomonas methanica TaxID=421 RepID=UPI000306C62F|nr:hypothetical protein [Methylomonas methanica]
MDSTLPTGTECYLRPSARKALAAHRKGRQPATFISKDKAIALLAQKLGRGLKRFLLKDLRSALPAEHVCLPEKMA